MGAVNVRGPGLWYVRYDGSRRYACKLSGAADFKVRPGSLGKPVPGIQLDILDPAEHCPPNVVGEIMLKRRDGWFAIKDLGHRDADGYWWHDGRATMSSSQLDGR